jgi:hypothetical protein
LRVTVIIAGMLLAGCVADPPSIEDAQPANGLQTASAGTAHPARAVRPKRAGLPAPRSARDVQVARNVTAIMRGIRAVELERMGESCESAAKAGRTCQEELTDEEEPAL